MNEQIRRLVTGRRLGLLAVTVAFLAALPTLGAVESLTTASLTGPVTVATADGHAIKGTIQSVTPELLTVLPAPKPVAKARPGAVPADAPTPAAPEPMPLEWKDVKRTSIGLTARSALEIWKAMHPGALCSTCRGDRTVWCPTCKGTAHDPAAAANCKTCKGELLVPCKTRGEANGVINCTNGCLKLGIGTWSKRPDGKVQCKFNVGGGMPPVAFGETAIGDVIVLDLKTHTATDAGKCPICGGTTKIDDPVCHGTGQQPCPECLARRTAGPCPARCIAGRVVCPDCGGTGLKKT